MKNQTKNQTVQFAEIKDRFWAGLLDRFLAIVIALVGIFLIELFLNIFKNIFPVSPAVEFFFPLAFLFFPFLYFFISFGRYGQTIGYKIFKLKCVRGEEPARRGIGYFRTLVRMLVSSFFSFFLYIHYLAIGFMRNNQGFHDIVTNVYVLKGQPPQEKISEFSLKFKIISIALAVLAIFPLVVWFAISIFNSLFRV